MPNAYVLIACGAVLLVPIIGLVCAAVSWLRFRREWRDSVERHNRHIAKIRQAALMGSRLRRSREFLAKEGRSNKEGA